MDDSQTEEETRKAYAAPLGAIVSAIGSLACCLPLTFAGALGAEGASAMFGAVRPWLLVLSAILLAVGFVQLYRGGRSCRRRSPASAVFFWIAVGLFLAMLFFPQQIAGLMAAHWAS